jgi:CRISPR-associated protein Csd2
MITPNPKQPREEAMNVKIASYIENLRNEIAANLPVNPEKRWEASVLLEVHNSNPNGDPDQEGNPREYRGHGLMSGQSFKRPIRDYFLDVLGIDIYVARGVNLSADRKDRWKAEVEATKTAKKSKSPKNSTEDADGEAGDTVGGGMAPLARREFIDIRLFGAVLSDSRVTGAIQIPDGITLAPINIDRQSLTRVATDGAENDDGVAGANMGGKGVVEYGQYLFNISYSPGIGRVNNVTTEDLIAFWEALLMSPDRNKSTVRNYRLTDVVAFEHTSALGDIPEHEVRKGFKFHANSQKGTVIADGMSVKDFAPGGIRREYTMSITPNHKAPGAKIGHWDIDKGFLPI